MDSSDDGGMRSKIEQLFSLMHVTSSMHVYAYSILIGLITGFFGLGFNAVLHAVQQFIYLRFVGLSLPATRAEGLEMLLPMVAYSPFLVVTAPLLGGFLSAIVTTFFCPEAKGGGTDAIIDSFHSKNGRIEKRVPFFKSLATIFTVGFGGSAGKEGPIMQIGAGIGSFVGSRVQAGDRARRSLMLAGVAAGLSTVFRAPFGGALTAVEVVYREDIESDSLLPALLSAVSAYMVIRGFHADASVFSVPPVRLEHFHELVMYVGLGFLSVGVGFLFTGYYRLVQRMFEHWNVHPLMKPTLGGLVVGLVALLFPASIGDGLGVLQQTILGHRPPEAVDGGFRLAGFFLYIALLKIGTTSFTVGSGGSGGVFTPALFIGGMLGGAMGVFMQTLFPDLHISVVSFIMVGMGGFFIGVAHAPMAGMVMVCDMVGNYTLLPALMIVAVTSSLFSRSSIYKGQVENRFQSPAHYWDMNLNVLSRMFVGSYLDQLRRIAVVEPHKLVSDLEKRALDLKATDFIVIHTEGTYLGICSLRHFHHTAETDHLRNLLTAGDVARDIRCLGPDHSFSDALKVMMENEVDKVAVADAEGQVLGYLRFIDIMKLYYQKVR